MKVIGLMSGTSIDGIDAALVEITGKELDLQVKLLAGEIYPYPESLKTQILKVCGGQPISMNELASLDDAIALNFASAAEKIQQQQCRAELIGSHGQTIYHRSPQENIQNSTLGYSFQIGRGELIADATQIPTVNNFRVGDIAAGGEGAPLVSKIDACLLAHPTKYRAIQNLGGIANATYLPPKNKPDWMQKVVGWDTGPANILIDLAIWQLTNGELAYDLDGKLAAQGTPNLKLVARWLEEDFFQSPPPKSTGRELFGGDYLTKCRQEADKIGLNESDWIATITELTVASIVRSYRDFMPQLPEEILLCGGGSRNLYLRQRLQAELTSAQILTTDEVGLNGDFKEAIAFAVLAYWRYHTIPGNLPQVTGASRSVLLGNIYYPPKLES